MIARARGIPRSFLNWQAIMARLEQGLACTGEKLVKPPKCLIVLTVLAGVGGSAAQVQAPASPSSAQRDQLTGFVAYQRPWRRTYDDWWRPVAGQADEDRVKVAVKALAQLEEGPVASFYGRASDSKACDDPYFYAMLSTRGERGAALLKLLMTPYLNGGEVDNRWLYAVAALGRSASSDASASLDEELTRLSKKAGPPRAHEPQYAVVDAMLCWQARNDSLTLRFVDDLCQRTVAPENLVHVMAWEHVCQFSSKEAIRSFLTEWIAAQDSGQIGKALASTSYDRKQIALVSVLDESLVLQECVIENLTAHEAKQGPQARALLLSLLLSADIMNARMNDGKLSTTLRIGAALDDASVPDSPSLSACCAVVRAIVPHGEDPVLKRAIDRRAAGVAAKDAKLVEWLISEMVPDRSAVHRQAAAQTVPRVVSGFKMTGFAPTREQQWQRRTAAPRATSATRAVPE